MATDLVTACFYERLWEKIRDRPYPAQYHQLLPIRKIDGMKVFVWLMSFGTGEDMRLEIHIEDKYEVIQFEATFNNDEELATFFLKDLPRLRHTYSEEFEIDCLELDESDEE